MLPDFAQAIWTHNLVQAATTAASSVHPGMGVCHLGSAVASFSLSMLKALPRVRNRIDPQSMSRRVNARFPVLMGLSHSLQMAVALAG
jgi:hypothetical protein